MKKQKVKFFFGKKHIFMWSLCNTFGIKTELKFISSWIFQKVKSVQFSGGGHEVVPGQI
jgi:hypothetical protein